MRMPQVTALLVAASAMATPSASGAQTVYVPNAELDQGVIVPDKPPSESDIFEASPATPSMSPDGYSYSTMSGPFQNLHAALVVRNPTYLGQESEQASAIAEAKLVINERYCRPHETFTVNPQFIWFDNIQKLWGIAGQCLVQ